MRRLRESWALSALVLAALALVFSLSLPRSLPGPAAAAAMTPEAAEAALSGLPRKEILSAWGEPDGMLSGFFGDVYALDGGGQVIIYYDTEPMNQGTAGNRTVPVAHIACIEF